VPDRRSLESSGDWDVINMTTLPLNGSFLREQAYDPPASFRKHWNILVVSKGDAIFSVASSDNKFNNYNYCLFYFYCHLAGPGKPRLNMII
jgi:hypothetical protein